MKRKLLLMLCIPIAFVLLSTNKIKAEGIYPNLTLIKNIEPKEIYTPGDQINYEITVNNDSSEYAENIIIEDVLDPRLEFVSQNSLDYKFTQQQQKLQWLITSLDPWSNYTIDFSTKLGFNISNGTVIGNKIRAEQNGIEDIFSNNIEFTVTAGCLTGKIELINTKTLPDNTWLKWDMKLTNGQRISDKILLNTNTFKLDGFPIGSEAGLNLELNDNSYTLTNNETLFRFTDTTCKSVDGMQITGKLATESDKADSMPTGINKNNPPGVHSNGQSRLLVEAGNNIFELILIDLSIVFATLILIVRKYKRNEKIHI